MVTMGDIMNEKRKRLLDYKQKLLNDMKYFDSRIREAQNKSHQNLDFDDGSSDSDIDMTANIDLGPNISELKQMQSRLKTCLQATEELTGVHVLESQVEVLVQDPNVEGQPITEPGVWYEVFAECKLDLVNFLITFLMHKSNRKFGPTHYRNLKVNAVKKAHELEMAAALANLDSPGNAVKLVAEFAVCQRARRSSLARLADKFAGTLLMAPRAEGGFTLKCLDVLEMWWSIKFSRSKGTFNHSLKFDIERIDDIHLQIIRGYYQQLDPTISTDKRTLILEKILHTCIDSTGTTLEMYESTESDQETIERHQYNKKLLDNHEPNTNRTNKQTENKDSEIMAPPKTLPKKTKPKGKENKVGNDTGSVKRSIESETANIAKKKIKKDTKVVSKVAVNDNESDVAINKKITQNDDKIKKNTKKEKLRVEGKKVVKKNMTKLSGNSEKVPKNSTNKEEIESNKESKVSKNDTKKKDKESINDLNKDKESKNTEDKISKSVTNKENIISKSVANTEEKISETKSNKVEKTSKNSSNKDVKITKNITNKDDKLVKSVTTKEVVSKNDANKEKISKNNAIKEIKNGKNKENKLDLKNKDKKASQNTKDKEYELKKTNSQDPTKAEKPKNDQAIENTKKDKKTQHKTSNKQNEDVPNKKTKGLTEKEKTKNIDITKKTILDRVSTLDKIFEKRTANPNVANKKIERKSIGKIIKRKSTNTRRGTFTIDNNKSSPKNKIPTIPPKNSAHTKQMDLTGVSARSKDLTGVSATSKNLTGVSATSDRVSKIPQKTSSFIHVGPSRISPRKLVHDKLKTSARPVQKKPGTQIPRLLKNTGIKSIK